LGDVVVTETTRAAVLADEVVGAPTRMDEAATAVAVSQYFSDIFPPNDLGKN
jgi:hypothetical protein